ncbi:hypothetical protein PSTG_08446 [Puccinia striiformis f. sp. tritici PST-78]|uniref:Uncharacterized protein n=1 Tax=Puccinia striiformis f. sp. tritici PST-78 TaxID=1165861 RepID=A0A0L0VGP8_9BASI|nr:hypothetical protein PSTG_08446 [Puccinia striiformis f. sp. tritici PST-78]
MTTTKMTSTAYEPDSDCSRIRSFRKLRFDSLERIRSIYRRATKSFLLNHHCQVWSSISAGLERIAELIRRTDRLESSSTPWWLTQASTHLDSTIDSTLDHELLQLDRKFQILKITFLTSLLQASTHSILNSLQPNPNTAKSSSISSSSSSSSSSVLSSVSASAYSELTLEQHDLLSSFLKLNGQPEKFILRLLSSISPDPCEDSSSLDQLPTASFHSIHPSIITALGLASIKLGIPRMGKQVIEAWFSSIECFDLNFTSHSSSPQPTSTAEENSSQTTNLTSDLRLSYQNLIQIYSIHILGALDEWPFAIEFIQSHQSAEILPVETVQNIIEAIKAARIQQTQLIKHSIQRQQQRREDKVRLAQQNNKKIKASSVDPRTKTSTNGHHSAEEGPTRTIPARPFTSRPNSQTISEDSSPTGFAGLRNHLANFVASEPRRSPEPTDISRRTSYDHRSGSPTQTRVNKSSLAQLKINLLTFFHLPFSSSSSDFTHHHSPYLKLVGQGGSLILTCLILKSIFARNHKLFSLIFNKLKLVNLLFKLLLFKFAQLGRMASPQII